MGEVLLFIVALFLLIILAPIGFIFGLLPREDWWERTQKYLGRISYTIDQSGNVICKDLFNYALIKNDIEEFGNPDETISSVLGKNKKNNNLTPVGEWLDGILDKIDPNHSINSIEEDE